MKSVSLNFRDAGPNDAADVSAIGRETFVETFGMLYKLEDLKSFLDTNFNPDIQLEEIGDPNTDIRLAFSGKKAIAYAKLGAVKLPIEHDPTSSLELHRLYVRGARQGVGVGRILLTWAIEQARQRGAKHLFLGVWENNQRAISVYEGRGFKIVGRYKFPVGNTMDDEVIMRLDL